LRSFKEDETKYFSQKLNDLKSDLEALSLINNSIKKDVSFVHKYPSTTATADSLPIQQSLESASALKFKNYLTTSLTRMNNLANFDFDATRRAPVRSAFESDPDILHKQNNLMPSTKYNRKFINTAMFRSAKSYSNTDTETIESSHSDSDDAKGPIFSSDVYGSRPSNLKNFSIMNQMNKPNNVSNEKAHSVGIYDRKKFNSFEPSIMGLSKNEFLDKEPTSQSDKLDPDYLRLMDKKLKKLIKKNLNQDLQSNTEKANKNANNLKEKENAIAWEIEPLSENKNYNVNDDSIVSKTSTAPSYDISPPPHPYLPLRDVPMHEIVKKLQREFEMESTNNDKMTEMNKLWSE